MTAEDMWALKQIKFNPGDFAIKTLRYTIICEQFFLWITLVTGHFPVHVMVFAVLC